MLMRLHMLKFSVGNGRQVIKQLCCRVLQYYATVASERAGYVLHRALVCIVMRDKFIAINSLVAFRGHNIMTADSHSSQGCIWPKNWGGGGGGGGGGGEQAR